MVNAQINLFPTMANEKMERKANICQIFIALALTVFALTKSCVVRLEVLLGCKFMPKHAQNNKDERNVAAYLPCGRYRWNEYTDGDF
jgi:hypothetical protein